MTNKNDTKAIKGMRQNTIKGLVEKIESSLIPELQIKRYILYFRERDSKNFIPYESNSDELIWHKPDSEESFNLVRPSMYNKGIPVYTVIRGQSESIELIMEKKNDKLQFREKILNSHESLAIQKSSARISILKREKISFAQALTTLLCCIITALTTYILCSPFMLHK